MSSVGKISSWYNLFEMDKALGIKLNNEQKTAVEHINGPLLIIAGAGTGKTAVITEKIQYLIEKGFAKPEEILGLTFTEKAATEMEERVDVAMPLSYGDIWITTFHGFCDQVLRSDGLHIGIPTNFKLMTKEKSMDLFKKNLFNFNLDYFRPLGNPNKFTESILSHFSRLQDEVISPVEYINWVNSKFKNQNEDLEYKKWEELARVYKEYNELKLKDARFDFGDLIIKTIELFQKRPNIHKIYEEKFKYVLVDEFQDTNYAQNILVNLLAKKHKNITVVGDDNQSIYRFRGAAISNILQFKSVYPDAKTITLNKNYRSTQKILDGAYRLIKNNDPDTLEVKLEINKKLIAVSKNKEEDIGFLHSKTGDDEAEIVKETIIRLTQKERYKYSDIAILVRANNHTEPFIREFERSGVPYQFLGPSKLLEREEIVDLIAYLKSLYDPQDSESFYRFLSSKFLNFNILDLIKLTSSAKKKSISVYEEACENEKFKDIITIFNKHINKINTVSAGEILYEYIKDTKIYEKIINNEEETKAKNIAKFFEKIKSFENDLPAGRQEIPIFHKVVDYISLLQEVGESPSVNEGDWQENNTVNILTVHSAKGLEFPVVFLVNLVSDRFPSRNRSDDLPIPEELVKEVLPEGNFHLQEERRLCYVGMTRACEKLYLTASDFYGDGKRKKKISPFVAECLGENPKYRPLSLKQIQISNFQNAKIPTRNTLPATNKLKISYLSVSQIETFKICPLHYKLKYIYKVPTSPSASSSFGISIHETLRQFYEFIKTGEKPTEELIHKIYKNLFVEEGYDNKKHKEKFFEKGKLYLSGFLKEGFDKKITPVFLEQKFTITLDKTLKIGGTIDRVDKLNDGRFEVIDYKTGANVPSQKEIDKDLQLSFYALAITKLNKVKPEDIKLSLYFLDTQEKITTKRTEKDLEKVKKEILEIRDEIQNSDFKCSNHYFCQTGCEYSMFCNKE